MDERNNDVIVEPDQAEDIQEESLVESDNIGETSVEFDVEELIAELEAETPSSVDYNEQAHKEQAHKRLEKILEQRQAAREVADLDDDDI